MLIQKLDYLRSLASEVPGYEQLYSLINGLTHPQQVMIRELAPDLPVETGDLNSNINRKIQAHRDCLYKELNELEEMKTDCDKQPIEMLYMHTINV